MRLVVRLLGAFWCAGGALLLAASVAAIWLWRAAALQVEGGYPPNALVVLHAIPYAALLFVVNGLMGLGAFAAGLAILRLRNLGRVAALVISLLAVAAMAALTLVWWVPGSASLSMVIALVLALVPFVTTLLVLTREPAKSLFGPLRPVA